MDNDSDFLFTTALFDLFKIKYPNCTMYFVDSNFIEYAFITFTDPATGHSFRCKGHGKTIEEAVDYAVLVADPSFWKGCRLARIQDYDSKFSLNSPIEPSMIHRKTPKMYGQTIGSYIRSCHLMTLKLEIVRRFLKNECGLLDGYKINHCTSDSYHKICSKVHVYLNTEMTRTIPNYVGESLIETETLITQFKIQTVDL